MFYFYNTRYATSKLIFEVGDAYSTTAGRDRPADEISLLVVIDAAIPFDGVSGPRGDCGILELEIPGVDESVI